MCRVEAEPVEVKLLDPVATIRDEKFADWPGIRAVKINRVAPFVAFSADQIIVGKTSQIISVGAKVVVNDIKNDT
jgi:hypothetical protein